MAGQAGGVRLRCARSREDVVKARQRCGRSREDVTKVLLNRERSREDVAKARQRCGRSREDVTKVLLNRERSREDVAKARQRCGRSREDVTKVLLNRERSREDVAKARQRCGRSREDVAKVLQNRERSREDVTKVRQKCGRSRENVTKMRQKCGRSREDVAKVRKRCERSRKDASKDRLLAAGTDKKKREGDKIKGKDTTKPSLFRTLGCWLLLQYLLPRHHYLGPGNALCRGSEEPVDEDDRIAQEHDREYGLASTKQDVRRADRAAIGRFWCNLVTTWNWHSIVGLFIVSIKYAVESLLPRPIYPLGLSQHSDERCIQGKVIGAKSKTLQGAPPRRCPCPGQYVGRTPQETPGHRMNRPPSPPKYFTDFSVVSETSLAYTETEPTPYTTPGHRMSRPPSPPRVFTYDAPGLPSSRAGTPYMAASSPGSGNYTYGRSSPQRCPGAPLAHSSPIRSPSVSSQATYSPGLSPVSSCRPRDDVLNRAFNANPNATFSVCPEDETLVGGPADATFSVCPEDETLVGGPADATFSVCPEDETLVGGPADATFSVCPEDETFVGGRANETFNVGRGNETYAWEDSDAEGIFEDMSLEDDVFEPPGCPRVKKKPPPLVIQEDLNETFTIRAPGQGFAKQNTDSPLNETYEEGGIDDCLRERIEQSQERVRTLIGKLQALINTTQQCKREDLNRTY
ncbi:uncharacterized protein LOC124362989 isoform X3 [Homalodisca vitripennis]|uniref:uncharacterized protein LOC124362989 isoform X3 n=1 Tax=Homalodisca vitripennis TaxID=197043 RepID=UPI001EEBD0D4|nr:uncharacterized protein LOC124362989 isoform X3 [Homalodisca vitripennis]